MRYLPLSAADRRQMLEVIGVASIDELFVDVPASARREGTVDLPRHQGEIEVHRELAQLAGRNRSAAEVPFFCGAGAYRHHVPATVDHLIQRSEFLTSYTPYQPEISQGTLQVLFEFQTQVAQLTGMEVANASLYDGSTATAEAVMMAGRITKRKKAVLSPGLHPHYAETVTTLAHAAGMEVETLPLKLDAEADVLGHLGPDVACVVVQTPNLFGTATDITAIGETARAAGALMIAVATEVVSLGLLKSPGEMGADIVAAEGQSLGVGLNFGGPYVGLFACREKHLRQAPGRLCGETVDAEGRRGFVLTLSTREQHIRRDKATSNICTNSGLCALAFSIHTTLLGETGLRRLAELSHQQTRKLAEAMAAAPGFEVLTRRYFNEIAVRTPIPAADLAQTMADKGFLIGVPVSRLAPGAGMDDVLLMAATELTTDVDIAFITKVLRGLFDRHGSGRVINLANAGRPTRPEGDINDFVHPTLTGARGLLQDEPLIFELDAWDKTGVDLPETNTGPDAGLAGLTRSAGIGLPGLSEPQTLRHYVRLSQKNHAIDLALYPLGSCTMKHNPRLNERLARLPGFADIHPLQPQSSVQGAIELMDRLAHWLKTLTGMPAVALSPKAGAHGELCGLLAIRAAHRAAGHGIRSEHPRDTVLTPTSAHGTNPATAAFVGYDVQEIAQTADGRVDLADLRSKLGPHVAAIMVTNPNTCGLFERDIVEIAQLTHAAGAYFYCDGANFNAIVGRVRPGDLGVDAMHINLHKTFSTPHGGGGPGAGPVVLSEALAPFAPRPWIVHDANGFSLREEAEGPAAHAFGRMCAFHGQMGMFTRAYAYMLSHGADGLRQVAEDAVLNANYLKARLSQEMSAAFPDGPCMHEALFDDAWLEGTGITTLDFAKAMIDEGFHPMTMYFPLVVHGAMLIEPTETESKAELDRFADALIALAKAAKAGDVERFRGAPFHAPLRRLDETQAARRPKLRWKPEPPAAMAAE